MWFLWALLSAMFLGFYDVFKKVSLRDNAVIPVLFINTLLCSAFFLPLFFLSNSQSINPDNHWYVPTAGWEWHRWVILKSVLVLSSWICGYFAIKHLPLTIVGPINATRPVMTIVGAVLLFHESFNLWQKAGVGLALLSFMLLSRSSRREGISFTRNRWILLLILAAILGACSGLYDKFLLAPYTAGGRGLNAIFVQTWFNFYQAALMGVVFIIWRCRRTSIPPAPFRWKWSIVLISFFLTVADLCYFFALSHPDALIAIVSMTRRSSVLVSFLFGAFFLHESNLRSKSFDLFIVFLSLICLCVGVL